MRKPIAETWIPKALTDLPQWLVWRAVVRDGKTAKLPYCSDRPGVLCRTNTPTLWSSFLAALRAYEREASLSGIGFVFSSDDPFCGIDFDHCLDPDGHLLDWAMPHLRSLPTYREVSPSGTGVKAIVRASLPSLTGLRRGGFGPDGNGAIEVYDRLRYFAITGDIIDTTHPDPEPLQSIVTALHDTLRARDAPTLRVLPAIPSQKVVIPPSSRSILDCARRAANGARFSLLYDQGDIRGYVSESEADGALLMMLAYWTGRNPELMEALFSACTLGRREKWCLRPAYRERSIATACAKVSRIYSGRFPAS